jgi:hypothetical protein
LIVEAAEEEEAVEDMAADRLARSVPVADDNPDWVLSSVDLITCPLKALITTNEPAEREALLVDEAGDPLMITIEERDIVRL